MILAVVLGAGIMLVGVVVGFIFSMASLESRKSNTVKKVKNITPIHPRQSDEVFANLLNKIDEKERDLMKEKLERALALLRENSGEIPEAVGDEIEELLQNVVNRMNP